VTGESRPKASQTKNRLDFNDLDLDLHESPFLLLSFSTSIRDSLRSSIKGKHIADKHRCIGFILMSYDHKTIANTSNTVTERTGMTPACCECAPLPLLLPLFGLVLGGCVDWGIVVSVDWGCDALSVLVAPLPLSVIVEEAAAAGPLPKSPPPSPPFPPPFPPPDPPELGMPVADATKDVVILLRVAVVMLGPLLEDETETGALFGVALDEVLDDLVDVGLVGELVVVPEDPEGAPFITGLLVLSSIFG